MTKVEDRVKTVEKSLDGRQLGEFRSRLMLIRRECADNNKRAKKTAQPNLELHEKNVAFAKNTLKEMKSKGVSKDKVRQASMDVQSAQKFRKAYKEMLAGILLSNEVRSNEKIIKLCKEYS